MGPRVLFFVLLLLLLALNTPKPCHAIPSSLCPSTGLIFYYDGSSLSDQCQQNNFGSPTNAIPQVSVMQGPQLPSRTDSSSNDAINFDQDYVDVLKSSPLIAPHLHLTLSFWVKSSVTGATQTIFSYASDFKMDIFAVQLINQDTFRMILVGINLDLDLAVASLDWSKWNHFTLSLDLEFREMKLYINGDQFATENLRHFASFPMGNTASDGANLFALGSRFRTPGQSTGTTPYQGHLDEIALYNRVLNGTEVSELFHNVGKPIFDSALSRELRWCYNVQGLRNQLGAPCSGRGLCTSFDTCSCNEGMLSYKCQNALQVSEYSSCPVNIISWWRAEGNTLDTCGRNNPEGWTNIRYSEGKIGLAFDTNSLDIVDSIVYINPLSTGFPLSEFTLSFWSKKTQGDTGMRFVFGYYLETQNPNNMLVGYSESNLVVYIHGKSTTVLFPPDVDPFDWLYISVTWTSTTGDIVFYLNGKNVSTVPDVKTGFQMEGGGSVMMMNEMDCMGGCSADFQQFRGFVDEFVLYKEALTHEEVQTLYENDGIIFNNCFGLFEVDPNVCSIRGICEGLDRCRCTPPFMGEQCSDTHDGFVIQTFGSGQQGQNGLHYLMDYNYAGSIKRDGSLLNKKIYHIGCGSYHCVVSTEDDYLLGFGANLNGSLGVGDAMMRSSAVEVLSMRGVPVQAICGRASGTLVLARNNTLIAFGSGSALGNGQSTDQHTPVLVDMSGVLFGEKISSIHCGHEHHYVLSQNGFVFSWGAVGMNLGYNPLGNSSMSETTTPIQVSLPGQAVVVASGDHHALALTLDNAVYVWGSSSSGQSGLGISNIVVPVQIPFFDGMDVLLIAAGGSASFVMTNDTDQRNIWAFGRGTDGNLGTGDFNSETMPVQIDDSPLANCTISSIVPSFQNTYILCVDGSVFSSGASTFGALGDRSTTPRSLFGAISYNPVEHKRYDKISAKRNGLLLKEAAYCDSIISLNTQVCNGRGKCVNPDVCECQDGWHGQFCEIPFCESISASDEKVCRRRGQCIHHNKCMCEAGYSGDNCELFECFGVSRGSEHVCNSHGTCVDIDQCVCSAGFTAPSCAIHSCFSFWEDEEGVCSNHGSCVSKDSCECMEGYFGNVCQLEEGRKPVAVVRAPSDVGLCDDIFLDGSRSYGSGLTFSWSVVENEPAVAQFLSLSSSAVLSISSSLLSTFGSLTFVLRLSNDQGYSDDKSTASVVVRRWAVSSPVLLFQSLQSWKVRRSAQFEVIASATAVDCQKSSLGTIQYSWNQVSGQTISMSDTTSPRLTFPAFHFPQEGVFEFDLTASVAGASTTQRVTVDIVAQPLRAIIAGGSARTHYSALVLTLDASPSFDPDQISGSETFSWDCVLDERPGTPCNVSSLPSERAIHLAGNTLESGLQYRFTVTYAKDSRVSNASVVVQVTATQSPFVELAVSQFTVNPQEVVNIIPVSESDISILDRSWSVLQGSGFSVSRKTVVSGTWDELLTRGELSIAPFALEASNRYTLQYSVTNGRGIGYSRTAVQVRSPPRFAKLVSSAMTGAQFETQFTLYIHSAENHETALLFRFEYTNPLTGRSTLLKDYGPQNIVYGIVFPFSGEILVQGFVKDSFGAVFSAELTLTVEPKSLTADQEDQDIVVKKAVSLLVGGTSTQNLFSATDILNFYGNQSHVIHLPSRKALRKTILSSMDSLSLDDQFELMQRLTAVSAEIDESFTSTAITMLHDKACHASPSSTMISMGTAESMLFSFSQLMDAAQHDDFRPMIPIQVSENGHKSMQCISSLLRANLVNGQVASEVQSNHFGLLLFQDTYGVIQKMADNSAFIGSGSVSGKTRVKLSTEIGAVNGLTAHDTVSVELFSFDYDFFSNVQQVDRLGQILELNIYDAQTQQLLDVHSLSDGIVLQFGGLFNVSSSLSEGKLFVQEGGIYKKGVARYWDESTASWRTDGCVVMDSFKDRIYVTCNHTTMFGVFAECFENCNETSPTNSYFWIMFVVLGIASGCMVCGLSSCCVASLSCVCPCLFVKYRRNKEMQKVYQDRYEKSLMKAYMAAAADELILKEDERFVGKVDVRQKRQSTNQVSFDNWTDAGGMEAKNAGSGE
eukprot:CAMPEP_0117451564 /NCGR_PEP_ID=MMETSP0759-20121206/9079_1 /TAXON_ID=63605 /ORGANISM="Percolomonas cosmopolitus, Strain WS" /LENGTH=2086 /DNA_ID=CAMNT_0005244181 /DNA_START=52 /DNA_END=6312 /DNA_ORIENTATION=-